MRFTLFEKLEKKLGQNHGNLDRQGSSWQRTGEQTECVPA